LAQIACLQGEFKITDRVKNIFGMVTR
jgi:hypothetical protein